MIGDKIQYFILAYEKCLDIRHPCIGYVCPIDMECHIYQPDDGQDPEPTCKLGHKRFGWLLERQLKKLQNPFKQNSK